MPHEPSPRGIITVLNTPFTDNDTIDFTGLRKNVSNAIDADVAGFLIPALASEVHSLSSNERVEIIQTVVEETAGRVPVIGGASANTQRERLNYAEQCEGLGCDGVLINAADIAQNNLARNLEEIANTIQCFLMLQDWDPIASGLPIELITELLASIPKLTWLKIEVVSAGPKYTQVLEATGGKLNVAGGWAVMQMIEALDRGVHAFMPTAMHRIYTEIYRRYTAGDRDAATDLFHAILPALAFSNQRLEVSIHFFKRLLHAQGVYATPRVRPPIKPLDPLQERHASEHIRRVIAIEAELSSQSTDE